MTSRFLAQPSARRAGKAAPVARAAKLALTAAVVVAALALLRRAAREDETEGEQLAVRMSGEAATESATAALAVPSAPASSGSNATARAESREALASTPDIVVTAPPPPRFAAPPSATLVGRLVTPAGEPLAGVRLSGASRGRLTWSDAERRALVGEGVYLLIPDELRSGPREPLAEFLRARFEDPREALALLDGAPLPADSSLTDAHGLFHLEVAGSVHEHSLRLEDPTLVLLGSRDPLEPGSAEGRLYLAAPAHPLAGTVLDASGPPLAGVTLQLGIGPPSVPGELSATRTWYAAPQETVSDEQGAFHFAAVPARQRFALVASLEDETEVRYVEPGTGSENLAFTLSILPSVEHPVVVGRVVRSDGAAVADALVIVEGRPVRCEPDGTFRRGLDERPSGRPVYALASGHDPLVDEVLGAQLAGASGLLELGDLVLPSTQHELAGRVLDSRGTPCAEVTVMLADPTHLSELGSSLEAFTCGGHASTTTDAQGRFRLGGLLARPYRLELDDGSVQATAGPFLPPARELVLHLGR